METNVAVEQGQTDVMKVKSYTIALKGSAGHITLDDIDDIPDESFRYILQRGLDTIINEAGGMPKLLKGITKLSESEQLKAKEAVRKQAKENLKALGSKSEQREADLKHKGAKATKVAGVVEKEALRLAKEMVKDLLRANQIKISAYKASEHTSMAKDLLKDNPDLYTKAEANLKEREDGAKTTASIDIKKLFGAKGEDPNNKAKPKGAGLKAANEAKAAQKVQVAAKEKPKAVQAKEQPKVAPRVEPNKATTHHVTH